MCQRGNLACAVFPILRLFSVKCRTYLGAYTHNPITVNRLGWASGHVQSLAENIVMKIYRAKGDPIYG